MFEKFMMTPGCLKVLLWLLNHPDDEYNAGIIGIECDIPDTNDFMAILSVLEGVGFIATDELSENLKIRLDKDKSISQLLIHLKDEFNDNAFRSEQVSPSLAYLHSAPLKRIIDTKFLGELGGEEVLEKCKNYETLDISDPFNEDIYNLCLKLEESGEYEEFIERLEESLK